MFLYLVYVTFMVTRHYFKIDWVSNTNWMEMTEAFRIFVYMSYVYVYYAVSSRPYYKQQWGKRRQTRQRKKDMAVILNNPLSKLIISRGNHHTFLRHALNNPKCQGRCA